MAERDGSEETTTYWPLVGADVADRLRDYHRCGQQIEKYVKSRKTKVSNADLMKRFGVSKQLLQKPRGFARSYTENELNELSEVRIPDTQEPLCWAHVIGQ